jgi:hypothetical protein
LKHELDAVNAQDPLSESDELPTRVIAYAATALNLPIRRILGLKGPWHDYSYTKEDAEKVLLEACQRPEVTEEGFWLLIKTAIQSEWEQAKSKLDRRQWELNRAMMLASLPDEQRLAKIQRYEAHLSRQFYQSLHELQRLQAARKGLSGPAPAALDVLVAAPVQEIMHSD